MIVDLTLEETIAAIVAITLALAAEAYTDTKAIEWLKSAHGKLFAAATSMQTILEETQ